MRPDLQPIALWAAGATAALAAAALAGCGPPAAPPTNANAAPPAANAQAAAPAAPSPAMPAAPAAPVSNVHYVNSVSAMQNPQLMASLAYFSFDYPSTWKVDPKSGYDMYIGVSRYDAGGLVTEEFKVLNFALSDPQRLPDQLSALEATLSRNPGYRRLDESQTIFGGAQGLQVRYTVTAPSGRTLYCRAILIPGFGGGSGVIILMDAADTVGEVHSIDDLGVKGDLATIVNSFKLGDRPQ